MHNHFNNIGTRVLKGLLLRGTVIAFALISAGTWFYFLTESALATAYLYLKPRITPNDYWNLVDHQTIIESLVILACVVGAYILLVGSLKGKTKRKNRFRVFFRRMVGLLTVSLFVAVLGLAVPELVRLHTTNGRAVFLDTCGTCHESSRPLDFIQTRAGWQANIKKMSEKSGFPLSADGLPELEQYLLAARSVSIKNVVKGRCGRCHRPPEKQSVPFSQEQIVGIIDRLRTLDPRFCEIGVAEEISVFLASGNQIDYPYDPGLVRNFTHACEVCHFPDVIFKPADPDTMEAMLLRMQQKVPSSVSEEDALALSEMIQAELADPQGFRKRYPHSFLNSSWETP